MKFSEPVVFKTDLTFWIWWKFEVVMAKLQTGNFFCGHGVDIPAYHILCIQPLKTNWDNHQGILNQLLT